MFPSLLFVAHTVVISFVMVLGKVETVVVVEVVVSPAGHSILVVKATTLVVKLTLVNRLIFSEAVVVVSELVGQLKVSFVLHVNFVLTLVLLL